MTAAGEWDVHWDEYAASAELNPAQAYRRRLILDLLECGPHDRIVDIGSGQGDLARDLMAAVPGAEVVGLEVSRTGVEIAAAAVMRSARLPAGCGPRPPAASPGGSATG